MVFQHDTRDKAGKHANVGPVLETMGHKVIRSKLYVGDITLVNRQDVCIDLKAGLFEVESNLMHDAARFRAECKRAREAGIKLVILIEDEQIKTLEGVRDWTNPRQTAWDRLRELHSQGKRLTTKLPTRPPVTGLQLHGLMLAMSRLYGVEWRFAPYKDTARAVCDILGVGILQKEGNTSFL